MSKTTTIRIKRGPGDFRRRVPVGVNGQITHLSTDEDVTVGEHILSALEGSGIDYTVVSSQGETDGAESGVGSAPSTVAHTALQQEPVNEPIYEGGAARTADPEAAPPALGEGAKGSATGEEGDGTGFRDDAANQVQPSAGDGGATGGQDGETGSRTEGEGGEPSVPSSEEEGGKPGAAAEQESSSTPSDSGSDTGDTTAAPAGETIAQLTDRAGKVNSAAQLDSMIQQEKSRDGGGRSGAIKALEARRAELG